MTYQTLLNRLDDALQLAEPFSPIDLKLAQLKADLEKEQRQIEAHYQDWQDRQDYRHLAH
jgi:hypothetical protein